MTAQAILSGLIFLAVVLGIAGVYSILMDLFLRDRTKVKERLQQEFRNKQREKAKKTPLFRDLGKFAHEVAGSESIQEKLQTSIDQAGLEWTVQKLVMMSLLFATLGGLVLAIAFFATGPLGAMIAGTVGFCGGGFIPFMILTVKKRQRISKMRNQLPDTFDLMARVIRAGQTMEQAMQAVADEFTPPIALEFALCHEMMNLGIPDHLALTDMARRSGIMELKIFVMGLLIQKEVGGNLAELLDNLSSVVRDRFRINGQIQTLTAEGRLQAAVLLALPPGMLVIMLFLNPTYTSTLIEHPIMLVLMFVSEFIGWLWIRQIVNFDF